MISLKKHLDADPEQLLKSTRESYRNTLTAMGGSAVQVCPHISEGLQNGLLALRERLSTESAPSVVEETGKEIENELEKWGKTASEYFQQTAHEVKEIMRLVAETAQSVGERDQRYAKQFGAFASALESIADLNDLARVRESLGRSAAQLKTSIDRMVQDGQQSISKLRAEISVYEARLKEVEQMAAEDPVTGLANRRKVERQIELRVAQGRRFSIAIFDLNDFKRINDTHGHVAGDQILRQFAEELRSFCRASDMVSRWGGDEFMVVLEGDPSAVERRLASVADWVYGDYTIKVKSEVKHVKVTASYGLASWQSGESATAMIERADDAMYQQKATFRKEPGA